MHPALPEHRVKHLYKLRDSGMSYQAIRNAMGIGNGTISKYLHLREQSNETTI